MLVGLCVKTVERKVVGACSPDWCSFLVAGPLIESMSSNTSAANSAQAG
jgi:hypothetical protein